MGNNFKILLSVSRDLNEKIELVSTACNISKTEFIRTSIRERLSKIEMPDCAKKIVLDFFFFCGGF